MAVLHADIERLIAAAGLESTIIRPGMFASNALAWWATAIRADGVVRWPYGAAETAPVDDRDVAAVAARTLYQDGHAGGDYVLTGPESLSQAEQVSIIGDVVGRRVTFEELSPDEFRRETEGSWPRPAVDMLLAAWGATMGRPAYVTSTVFDILGSAPRSFRQWVADHATAFMDDPTSAHDRTSSRHAATSSAALAVIAHRQWEPTSDNDGWWPARTATTDGHDGTLPRPSTSPRSADDLHSTWSGTGGPATGHPAWPTTEPASRGERSSDRDVHVLDRDDIHHAGVAGC